MKHFTWILALCSLQLLAACGDGGGSDDDAGTSRIDAAASSDGGGASLDAAPGSDGGSTGDDAGLSMSDAGSGPGADAGPAGSDAGACGPSTNDTSAVGDLCGDDLPCPTGYTCQGFSGIVFAQSCQIRCDGARDCECPSGMRCARVGDKAGEWNQCEFLPD